MPANFVYLYFPPFHCLFPFPIPPSVFICLSLFPHVSMLLDMIEPGWRCPENFYCCCV